MNGMLYQTNDFNEDASSLQTGICCTSWQCFSQQQQCHCSFIFQHVCMTSPAVNQPASPQFLQNSVGTVLSHTCRRQVT